MCAKPAGLLVALVLLISMCGCGEKKAQSQEPPEPQPAPVAQPAFANPKPGLCPVSGDEADTEITATVGGKTYAFCCKGCAASFKKDPGKFLVGADEAAQAEPPAAADAKLEWQSIQFGKKVQHTLQVPKAWKAQEPENNMRLFQMQVPKYEYDEHDGEFLVFRFMAGGNVDDNLKRWQGQFGGEDALKRRTNDLPTASGDKASLVEFEGSYAAMSVKQEGLDKPRDNYRMFVAVIPTADGLYYLKLVGPKDTLEAYKPVIEKLVKSFK
ncbi:MAG: TRASH domain-containing protein [Planctomycetota bacterium]|nr:TRASH domain-containing protein [Planctomycetota bacterium]